MATTTIKQGEPYDISVQAKDGAGDPIVLDGDWTAAIRFVIDRIGCAEKEAAPMVIAAGLATYSVDTETWATGRYVWDVRLTNVVDTEDFWTDPVTLIIEPRITAAA